MTKDTTPTLSKIFTDCIEEDEDGNLYPNLTKAFAGAAEQLAACVPEKRDMLTIRLEMPSHTVGFNEAVDQMQANLNAFLGRPPEGEIK